MLETQSSRAVDDEVTTIGSLLQGLHAEERNSLHVAILIAEPHPEVHAAWSVEWLRHAVDEVFTYDVEPKEQERLEGLKQNSEFAEKGLYDYTYALQHCYEIGAPYIGMMEDDILLMDGWLIRTLLASENVPKPVVKDKGWLFMRLFNQERSMGWASHRIGGNNELWIVLGTASVYCSLAFLARRRWQRTRDFLDIETTALVALVLIPALVILFFQCGKASLLPPRAGIAKENFGCCSQAMIFPRNVVPPVNEFLRGRKSGQVDLLLDQYARETGLTSLALYPVEAQHLGLDSSRNTVAEEAQAGWSMAFEALDAADLARSHQRKVDEYYGRH